MQGWSHGNFPKLRFAWRSRLTFRSWRPSSRGAQRRAQHTYCIAAGRRGTASKTEAGQETTEEFHAFFGAQLGERWPQLYGALARPTSHVALLNPFLGHSRAAGIAQQQLPGSTALPEQLEPWRAASAVQALQYTLPEGGPYPQPTPDPDTGLRPWYWLDWASLVPPLALGVAPGQHVLDMCAAPGGKSLVLAQLLFSELCEGQGSWPAAQQTRAPSSGSGSSGSESSGSNSRLVCNEIDAGRRRRLLGVLRDYVPEPVRLQSIRVTPHDGAAFWRSQELESYDRILLDAPCSSDRHIVQQAETGSRGSILKADWSAKRCKAIAGDQAKLLAAAVKALKPGGRLVYSTCSLAEVENDQVVSKVLHKAGPALVVVSHTLGSISGVPSSRSRRRGSSTTTSSRCHPREPAEAEAALPSCLAGSSEGEHLGSCRPSEQQAGDTAGAAGGGPVARVAVPGGAAWPEWVTAADFEAWGADKTKHGWLLLPDRTGFGPMYVCVLEKVASSDLKRVKVNKYADNRGTKGGKHVV